MTYNILTFKLYILIYIQVNNLKDFIIKVIIFSFIY